MEIEKRNIPLQVSPNRPTQNYAPNWDKAQAWITSVKNQYRNDSKEGQVAQKAIDNIQYISMEIFDKQLTFCVQKLNDLLKKNQHPDFSVGIVCGKSNQWVTSLALKDLDYLPSSWFSLGSKQGTIDSKAPTAEFDMAHVKEETIVLFDDCSYTGTQLMDNLKRIKDNSGEKKRHVYVVIPFMSKDAQQQAKSFATTEKFELEIITTNETIKQGNEIFDFNNGEMKILQNLNYNARAAIGPTFTLCYTAWRLPDAASFLHQFGTEKMARFVQMNGKEKELVYLKEEEAFLPLSIRRPYEIQNS
jgi:phosphoribosylpyrophosphate synthetase